MIVPDTFVEWFCASANLPRDIVTPDAALAEIGLDSLTATELTVLIEEHYIVRVQPAVLWECPTLRAVAEYVERLL